MFMKQKITIIIDDEKMTEKLYYELISKTNTGQSFDQDQKINQNKK
jgi:hypothetical protein